MIRKWPIAPIPISLADETRISFSALASRESVNVSTVWRWCLRGVRGIRLESISVGGRKYTSVAAFLRWSARVNNQPVPSRTASQRTAALEQADRDLADIWN